MPAPEKLDLEALRRLKPQTITALGRGDSIQALLVPAHRWPFLLAALAELEELRAEVEQLLKAWPEPEMIAVSVLANYPKDFPRIVRILRSAREAKEVSGGC